MLNRLFTSKANKSNHYPILFEAVESGNIDLIKKLLQLDINLESRNKYGSTALLLAASQGNIETTALLLAAGANVDTKNRYGVTPLLVAASKGHVEVINALLGANANKEARDDESGRTPLIWAACKGHLEAVKVLVAAGANRKATDYYFQNALSVAKDKHHDEIANILQNTHKPLHQNTFRRHFFKSSSTVNSAEKKHSKSSILYV